MTNLNEMDIEAFLNIRDWFEAAIEAHGGKVIDGGMGGGRADLGVELDGFEFSLWITPRTKSVSTLQSVVSDETPLEHTQED